jgi:hypothetical protein
MTDPTNENTTEQPAALNASPTAYDTPKKRGRPAIHENPAARQKAWRERLKTRDMRVLSRVVPDRRGKDVPLHSDIIDLSEVRGHWRA